MNQLLDDEPIIGFISRRHLQREVQERFLDEIRSKTVKEPVKQILREPLYEFFGVMLQMIPVRIPKRNNWENIQRTSLLEKNHGLIQDRIPEELQGAII